MARNTFLVAGMPGVRLLGSWTSLAPKTRIQVAAVRASRRLL
ncbi:hypothetical protein AAK684_06170 [Leptogranulimonas caecicola]|nr:hypothetical protein [Leptogranulimonas caecicola]